MGKIYISNNMGKPPIDYRNKYSKKSLKKPLTNNTRYDTIKVGKNPNSIRNNNKKRKEK